MKRDDQLQRRPHNRNQGNCNFAPNISLIYLSGCCIFSWFIITRPASADNLNCINLISVNPIVFNSALSSQTRIKEKKQKSIFTSPWQWQEENSRIRCQRFYILCRVSSIKTIGTRISCASKPTMLNEEEKFKSPSQQIVFQTCPHRHVATRIMLRWFTGQQRQQTICKNQISQVLILIRWQTLELNSAQKVFFSLSHSPFNDPSIHPSIRWSVAWHME